MKRSEQKTKYKLDVGGVVTKTIYIWIGLKSMMLK